MHKTILFSSAFTLGAFVSPLNAQTPTNTEPTEVSVLSDEEALTLDARYYARTYGTSLEEAMRRVALMASAQEDLADGIVQAGGRYAGAFFNHDGEFELVILTTGTEQMPSGTITRRGKGAVASQ
ncbi:hypothetical protein OAS19_01680 [Altererythrobacter sp.]|nr:hypothetical protein [Altererythrobacter sp.]